jgi:hypothetical protein
METGKNDGNSGRSHGGAEQPSGRGNNAQSTTGDSGSNAASRSHAETGTPEEDNDLQDDGGGWDTLKNDDDTSRAPESGSL